MGIKKTVKDYLMRFFFPQLDSIVHSVPERSYDFDLSKHIITMTKIRDASVVEYEAPPNMPAWFRKQHAFPTRFVYRVSDCVVYIPLGCVRLGKYWLQESVGHYRHVLINVSRLYTNTFLRMILRRRRGVEQQLVTCLNVTGYYHFLLEALPCLLHVLCLYPKTHVIVNNSQQFRFVASYLEMLNHSALMGAVTEINVNALTCKEYVFTGMEEKSGFVCKADVCLLRDIFLPFIKKPVERRSQRIFISRRNASRRFDNQEEIENAVQAAGLKIVDLEGMEICAQMLLFNQAELVVANHGAGLANLVWGSSEARVVELFSPQFLNDCYFRMARTIGMSYDYIIAEGGGTWGKIEIDGLMQKINRGEMKEFVS